MTTATTTTSGPTQATRAASQELRRLVGIPWSLGGLDPVEGGLDCLGLMVKAYEVIGRHLEEPARWRFPVPLGYPYPAPLPDGSWMPEASIDDWARHWQPLEEPVFGCAIVFLLDHVGVAIQPAAGPGFDVLHTHRSSGTVIHPLRRLKRWATGYYLLRQEPRPG